MSSLERLILVVERAKFPSHIPQEGFIPMTNEQLDEICDLGEFKIRNEMEENSSYKQLIPYITVICDGKILVYKRSTKGQDERLHERYSLGVGGHIDLVPEIKTQFDTFVESVEREVEEELGINIKYADTKLCGFINLDDGTINDFHIGVGITLTLDSLDLEQGETDVLVERQFLTPTEAMEMYDKMERWSQIFLREYLSKLK